MEANDFLRSVLPHGIPTTFAPEPEYKCPVCKDTGWVVSRRDENGIAYYSYCECQRRKANASRIERSGLSEQLKTCTFATFQTPEIWQTNARETALRYCAEGEGSWFVITGTPGTGKTHLCTAIVGELMNKGIDCRYMMWRDEAPQFKGHVNDREWYDPHMDELKAAPVLYIDDFFKGRITDADINFAFELLNHRYNTRKRTIISGEMSINDIIRIDEALGSRIYQRSKGYCIRTPKGNWRLK